MLRIALQAGDTDDWDVECRRDALVAFPYLVWEKMLQGMMAVTGSD